MKIRIKGNSIRFRLTRSEVATFCEHGHYEEKTLFDNGSFSYGLQMIEDLEELSAELKAGTITLNVPRKMAAGWSDNNKVGFENIRSLENGDTLHLLLEKDFTCLENRAEDESDNYPNPKMAEQGSNVSDK